MPCPSVAAAGAGRLRLRLTERTCYRAACCGPAARGGPISKGGWRTIAACGLLVKGKAQHCGLDGAAAGRRLLASQAKRPLLLAVRLQANWPQTASSRRQQSHITAGPPASNGPAAYGRAAWATGAYRPGGPTNAGPPATKKNSMCWGVGQAVAAGQSSTQLRGAACLACLCAAFKKSR